MLSHTKCSHSSFRGASRGCCQRGDGPRCHPVPPGQALLARLPGRKLSEQLLFHLPLLQPLSQGPTTQAESTEQCACYHSSIPFRLPSLGSGSPWQARVRPGEDLGAGVLISCGDKHLSLGAGLLFHLQSPPSHPARRTLQRWAGALGQQVG